VNLRLQIRNVKASTRLHRRKLDEGGYKWIYRPEKLITSARTTTQSHKIYLGEASVAVILLAIIPCLLLLRAPVARLAGRRKGRP